MLRGVLEAQAPPKQTATETIDRYGDRLANATLLEDRRGAIQGLRSLAKEYPASVASKSLRDLISTLTRDSGDVETAQIVLEALLALFNPNEDSPEASDDIALWLADEFSQRQDNISALTNLLEKGDFYSTLHSLQLLSAISSARPERTKECILSAPLGTARLVGVLDDSREAIRSAGILLLNDVTESSPELQKLVAFENAFERVFNLIQSEGSIAYGGIVVQDCLSLLANLLHLNSSNQSLFRESGLVPRLGELLLVKEGEDEENEPVTYGPNPTRDRNLWGVLALLRMFVVEGSKGTQASQIAFEKHGILHLVLLLGFDSSVSLPIRAEALKTCADMIRANTTIQERFGHNEVPWKPVGEVNGGSSNHVNGVPNVHVVDGLLALTLTASPSSTFDLRFAACNCLEAYFANHHTIRLHFLGHAIHLHSLGQDNESNILSILIAGPQGYDSGDPYRLWFAAILAFRLINDDPEAKNRVMAVVEGDADKGEEVVTCIQAIAGNLVQSLQSGEDERVCIGYLILLCGWLFDDFKAVNDFLGEGSSVQSLIQTTGKNGTSGEIIQGLCAFLLGLLYEFSTKDSPIPRRRIQEIILSSLGRDQYIQKISKLRIHHTVREFEVTPQDLSSADTPGAQPNVFYDSRFVEFLKDNFSRLIRAIDRDPNLESGGPDKAVDRNLVDDVKRLESELQDQKAQLKKSQEKEIELDGEIKDHVFRLKKSQEKEQQLQEEVKNHKARLETLQKSESSMKKSHESQEQRLKAAEGKHSDIQALLRDHQSRLQKVQQNESDAQATIRALEEQMAAAKQTQSDLQTSNKDLTARLDKSKELENSLSASAKDRAARLKDAQQTIKDAQQTHTELEATIRDREAKLKEARTKQTDLETKLRKKDEERDATQTELDDMLIVLGELEEKRSRDKKKLKELGAATSEGEDEDDEEEEDEADEEEAKPIAKKSSRTKETTEDDVD